MNARSQSIASFLQRHGWGDAQRTVLAGDASFRRYDRLYRADGMRAVLMDAPPPQEDVRPFIAVDTLLADLGLTVPTLLAVDETHGLLLLEDLGDDTYSRCLHNGQSERDLYRLAVQTLIHLHRQSPASFCHIPQYDDDRFLAEAALLVDWYCPAIGLDPLTHSQRAEYLDLWTAVLPIARSVPTALVLRDFHVDNLMHLPRPGIRACGLLDFQDAVIGPCTYDLISLLEDARRDIDPQLIAEMTQTYLAAFPQLDADAFAASWSIMAAQRHCKVIGIFTRLCRRDHKPQYLHHIPRVWRLLTAACQHPVLASLGQWLDQTIPPQKRQSPTP